MKSKFLLRGFLITILVIGESFSLQAADVSIDDFKGYTGTAALQAAWQETDTQGSEAVIKRYLDTGKASVGKVMRVEFGFSKGSTNARGVVGRPGAWNWSERTGISFWIKAKAAGDIPQYYQVRFYEDKRGDKWKSPLMPISNLNPNGQYVTIPFADFEWYGSQGGRGGAYKADRVMQLDNIVNLYLGAAYSGTAPDGGTTTLWIGDIAAAGNVLIRNPYLQNVTQTGVDVMWGSSAPGGTLYWGSLPGNYTNSVSGTVFAANAPDDNIYTAAISGLSPGETVYYYVSSGGVVVGRDDPSYYATAAPSGNASFRFIAYGDTRNDPVVHARVISKMHLHNPDIVIHTGDIAQNGQVWQYDTYYFTPAAPLIKNTPVFTTLGNHDLRWSGSTREYRELYSLPTNSVDGTEAYYSFDYGSVHFVSLNTALLPDGYIRGYRDTVRAAGMTAWLKGDLAATKKPWKVVFFHRPAYLSDVDAAFRKIFEDNGVNLVFSGHIHTYDSHYRNGVTYITAGGGGAPLGGPYRQGWPDYRLYAFNDYNFVVADVTLSKLDLKVYDDDNVLRQELILVPEQITKPVSLPAD
ncbi:MAG: hypothetical protein GXP33_15660 [Spirochaetes bacterium]|nr:hypothetical protein [Spirochaetota bacterium]